MVNVLSIVMMFKVPMNSQLWLLITDLHSCLNSLALKNYHSIFYIFRDF